MIEIDGSQYSASGTIVRQAVVFSALTGVEVHIIKIRASRTPPGLRPQHLKVVEAISELTHGSTEGLAKGSSELSFRPGRLATPIRCRWDIGSAGSATNLCLAVLPLLAFTPEPAEVEVVGGVFQDGAPSYFHLFHVVLPLLRRMGIEAEVFMQRPGYVPRGGGMLLLKTCPSRRGLSGIALEKAGLLSRVWGIALSSHLQDRQVSYRMAKSAQETFSAAGLKAEIEIQEDTTALQAGAAFAAFAETQTGARWGADQAGARGRISEAIGRFVAGRVLEMLRLEVTLDPYAADQILPFAALATGKSTLRIPEVTEHMLTNAWLAQIFLNTRVTFQGRQLQIEGAAFFPA
ncbi:MAG: RNA 3'-phosphate cyclase [Acidobacteria bacterium]|nr:RNA 3'-phosphate cyclase [Acidobacteriota bacterium]